MMKKLAMLVALGVLPQGATAQMSVDQLAAQTLAEPLQPFVYSWEKGSPPSVLVPAATHTLGRTDSEGATGANDIWMQNPINQLALKRYKRATA